jgi:hypothetical protein
MIFHDFSLDTRCARGERGRRRGRRKEEERGRRRRGRRKEEERGKKKKGGKRESVPLRRR